MIVKLGLLHFVKWYCSHAVVHCKQYVLFIYMLENYVRALNERFGTNYSIAQLHPKHKEFACHGHTQGVHLL